jgi:prevent-host-death family protein
MKTRTLREAQHNLSKIVGEVENGEEVTITRRGKPVVRIVSVKEKGNPFERRIDWATEVILMEQESADLPTFKKNIVLEMREGERY